MTGGEFVICGLEMTSNDETEYYFPQKNQYPELLFHLCQRSDICPYGPSGFSPLGL